jgi:hypothetical protein
MLRDSTTHPLTPHPKAARLETPPHHLYDLSLDQTGFFVNLIKCRPILPSHSDHLILELIVHPSSINPFPKNASRDDS